MVRSIARYAVIRKTQKDVNILTGNYEAAYAEGLLFHILNLHPKIRRTFGEEAEGGTDGSAAGVRPGR